MIGGELLPHFYRLLAEAWLQQASRRFQRVLRQSRLMFGVIGAFVTFYWVFLTWFLYKGILFIQGTVPALGEILIARMFYLFFASIFFMLISSSVVVGYGVFFRNRETAWLQTLPVSHACVFRWKFVEMSILASWAFLFLSGPLLLAYELATKAPLFFLFGAVVLYLPFSFLANVIGAAATLLLVRLWHDQWGRRGLLAFVTLAFAYAWHCYKPIDVKTLREGEFLPLMNLLLQNTKMAVTPFIPSYWLASSILGMGDRLWWKVGFFFLLTLGYALLAGRGVLLYGGSWFDLNASLVQDRRLHGRAYSMRGRWGFLFWSGRWGVAWMKWLSRPVRAILQKDWMAFWRDPAQWSQFAIFFGLLGLYFLNIRNFKLELDDRFWVSAVAFLNLASLGLILATLTTRFVFPQFSLEGRRMWLVGLAPISLGDVIWGKFWASAVVNGAITLGLMFFSFSSLRLDWGLRGLIGFSVGMMSLGLSGIAVGTGALFPNFRQHNAAQIVSGFGGTFCLVLSLFYVGIVVAMVAFPAHARYVAKLPLDFSFTSPVALLYIAVLLVSGSAACLPMWLALKKYERFEIEIGALN